MRFFLCAVLGSALFQGALCSQKQLTMRLERRQNQKLRFHPDFLMEDPKQTFTVAEMCELQREHLIQEVHDESGFVKDRSTISLVVDLFLNPDTLPKYFGRRGEEGDKKLQDLTDYIYANFSKRFVIELEDGETREESRQKCSSCLAMNIRSAFGKNKRRKAAQEELARRETIQREREAAELIARASPHKLDVRFLSLRATPSSKPLMKGGDTVLKQKNDPTVLLIKTESDMHQIMLPDGRDFLGKDGASHGNTLWCAALSKKGDATLIPYYDGDASDTDTSTSDLSATL